MSALSSASRIGRESSSWIRSPEPTPRRRTDPQGFVAGIRFLRIGAGKPAQRLLDVRGCRTARRRRSAARADPLAGRWAVPARDPDGERGALAGLGSRPRSCRRAVDQLLHQREADAGAFVGSAAGALDAGGSARRAAASPRAECRCRCRDRQLDAVVPRRASATAIVPSKVNLKAFESRLRTIFSHISRST